MKHSPTPWILTETPTHVTVRSANNECIFHDDKRLPEVLADARLIAAAPELLEALDTLTAVIGLTPIAGNKSAVQEAFDIARAVIEKTRGDK